MITILVFGNMVWQFNKCDYSSKLLLLYPCTLQVSRLYLLHFEIFSFIYLRRTGKEKKEGERDRKREKGEGRAVGKGECRVGGHWERRGKAGSDGVRAILSFGLLPNYLQ